MDIRKLSTLFSFQWTVIVRTVTSSYCSVFVAIFELLVTVLPCHFGANGPGLSCLEGKINRPGRG
jgi:hypothetical protein